MLKVRNKKISLLLFAFLLLLTFVSYAKPKDAQAASCSISSTTNLKTGDTLTINVTNITNSALPHKIALKNGVFYQNIYNAAPGAPNTSISVTIPSSIPTGNYDVIFDPGGHGVVAFETKCGSISLTNEGGGPAPSLPTCDTSISGTTITIKASNLKPNTNYSVYKNSNDRVGNKESDANGNLSFKFEEKEATTIQPWINMNPGQLPCSAGITTIEANIGPKGSNPCSTGTEGKCETALGDIPTTATGFAGKVLSIGLGLGGGIALIFMVYGSIRILISTGDPKKISEGREIIVAAVAGLLFIIFSVLILRFIGISILPSNPFT